MDVKGVKMGSWFLAGSMFVAGVIALFAYQLLEALREADDDEMD